MKTYFYKRANGILVRIEAEQMFWSGTACVFVKAGLAAAVISLMPGEIICEEGMGQQVDPPEGQRAKPN